MKQNDMDDTLLLPESWARHLLPWRGKRLGPDVKLDAAAPAAVAERIAQHHKQIEAALHQPENQDWAPAGLDHLGGEPSPAGAAVVLDVAESGHFVGQIAAERRELHLDAWVLEHGLPFAAAAMVESMPLRSWFADSRRTQIEDKTLAEISPHHAAWHWLHMTEAIARTRALLARTTDAEYAAAVAAIGAQRTNPVRRMAAALLMPTEVDWVEEACADQVESVRNEWILRSMASTAAHVAASGRTHLHKESLNERCVAALVDAMGVDGLPVLGATLTQSASISATERSLLFKAIGLLPGKANVAFLIGHLRVPGALNTLFDLAERTPDRVLQTLARCSRDADPDLREKLAGFAKTAPGLLDAAERLDSQDQIAIAGLVDESPLVPSAPVETLPSLLVSPPWKRERPGRKTIVVEGLAPTLEDRLVWTEAEQERWAGLQEEDISWIRNGFWDEAIARARKHSRFKDATYFFAWAPLGVAEPLLDKWDGSVSDPHLVEFERMLGRFGLRVLDRLTPHLQRSSSYAPAILPIQNLEAARLAADWLGRLKSLRPLAKRWLDRHAKAAAHLLLPDALGVDERRRSAANTVLRYLIGIHGAAIATEAARGYGDAAAEAIQALVEADPLDPGDMKIPKTPTWAAPSMLPQVLLKDRATALPAASVAHLTTVLAIATPDFPYAGVDVVTETCDRDALARFSWTLFELWTAAGSPAKDGWALTQLAHFADDDAVRELTAMVRDWPGQSQHKRAVVGLEVLGAVGSEAALRGIHGIAQKVKFKALKEKATEQIQAIAENLGLTPDQLGDRLVPDFGLDADATLLLDYGPRRFKVGFDEALAPVVHDLDGKPRKSLPKPGAKDDAELAEAAYKRFTQLKKELRSVANDQIARLKRAMVEGRTWTSGEFREFFVDHPLSRHLARRLIWLAESGGVHRAFRIAEDLSLTDVDDDAFTLPEDAVVSLAHPARLGAELAAWGEVLSDYEILQPFDQVGRPVMAFTDEELRTGRLTRFEGVTVETVRLLGMTHWGWHRAAPEDGGCEPGLCYQLPQRGFVVLALDPGVYVGDPAELPEQTVRGAYLSDTEDYDAFEREQEHPHPTEIDPVTASEVLGALARITRAA